MRKLPVAVAAAPSSRSAADSGDAPAGGWSTAAAAAGCSGLAPSSLAAVPEVLAR